MDKITIIVPVYNQERFLDKCLESVIEQTYRNTEIIAVDDGSTDNSPKMLDEWAKKDSRIKVIHKKNEGLSSARNVALDIATGEYIAMIDSDDFWEKDALETLVTLTKSNDADMVVARGRKVDTEGKLYKSKEKDISIYGEGIISEDEFWKRSPLNMYIIVVWSKLYKREVWENVRFPQGMIYEDLATLCDVVKNCNRIYASDKVVYNWRINPDSITRQSFSKKNLCLPRAYMNNIEYLGKAEVSKETRYAFVRHAFSSVVNILAKGYDLLKDETDRKELKQIYSDYRPIARELGKNVSLTKENRLYVKMLMFNYCHLPKLFFCCRKLFKGNR